jgi:translation initiation factor IF-2
MRNAAMAPRGARSPPAPAQISSPGPQRVPRRRPAAPRAPAAPAPRGGCGRRRAAATKRARRRPRAPAGAARRAPPAPPAPALTPGCLPNPTQDPYGGPRAPHKGRARAAAAPWRTPPRPAGAAPRAPRPRRRPRSGSAHPLGGE